MGQDVGADTPPDAGEPDFDWSWAEDDSAAWIPPAIDMSTPSSARMYDYALGGKDHFAVDREAVDRIAGIFPEFRAVAQANRGFLVRAVEAMAADGIRQFIDLGTGIPTSPSVHEVAQLTQPDAAVVYVDNDPIVIAHNRARQANQQRVVTLLADLRDPRAVLEDPRVQGLIDLGQPVGLLFCAVLHFVRRDAAAGIVAQYCRPLPSGSQLAIATACADEMSAAGLNRIEAIYEKSSTPIVFRSQAEVAQLFEGFNLTKPGLADVTRWRVRGKPLGIRIMAGLGIKP
jgi:S-adenosyl methyltransferase